MAGIFKSLDQSDIRVTPFRTHKLWYDNVSYCEYTNEVTGSITQIGTLQSNLSNIYIVDSGSGNIHKHNTADSQYELLQSVTVGTSLQAVKFGADSNRDYIVGCANSRSLFILDNDFNSLSTITASYVNVIKDISSDQRSDLLFYCGSVTSSYGVGSIEFGGGSFFNQQNLTPAGFYNTYVKINGEGFYDSGYAVTVQHDTSPTRTRIMDVPNNATFIIYNTNVGCKRIEYDVNTGTYYVLFETGDLYQYHPSQASLVMSNVADILADKDVTAINAVTPDLTRQLHVIANDGQIYTNFSYNVNTATTTVNSIIDTRRWLSTGREIVASINKNQSGMIGIIGRNTTALIDTVYYTVNPYTGEVTDPKHFGAVNYLDIYGENLNTFLAYDYVSNPFFADLECETSQVFSLYKADYQPISNHKRVDPLLVLFDQENHHYEYTEPLTANGKYQRVVHRSLEHIYYRNFYDNTRATFGSGNINTQFRFLEDQAQILSLPQSKFGEGILPESILINAKYNNTIGIQDLTLVDDVYGNLVITGSYQSPYGNYISGSVEKSMVGGWPFDKLYRYLDKGPISVTSSYNRGIWNMESTYDNVRFEKITSITAPNAGVTDLLGVVPRFTASLSSSIVLRPNEVSEYDYMYNFENGNFAISMILYPEATPTHPSGSILLSKEGPAEDLRTDENGNVYTIPATRRSPYRISLATDLSVKFQRDTNSEVVTLSSTPITLNTLSHVLAMKSGSSLKLYVNGALAASAVDVEEPPLCSNKANIYIGNSWNKVQPYTGVIDNIKIYNEILQPGDITILRETLGVGNSIVGNVFHNHGTIVMSSIPSRYMDVVNAKARGSHTIWETEISCTVGPGEFTRSNNPTMQEYDPTHNQFVFRSFVTGSSFRPFVTAIGLYDDKYRMVAVAKLSTPIQLPDNTDTTIIIRFDR